MDPIALMPLTLVGIFALGFPAALRRWQPARIGVVLVLAALFANYMSWRLPVTVLPATGITVQSVLVWFLFSVEMLAWLDAAILFTALCRRTDRTGEANAHEARLRAAPGGRLPVVDVFIATYNEPLDVLERTIVGALALDWPADRLRVWVLDDGRRGWLADYCRDRGAGYLTRPDNTHAKAGNINAAIARTSGEFIAVLDADFIPQRNFLYRMIGFFADPRIGIVQVPHTFFNHDPLQANLALRRTLPGDQSLFFGEIMPGRDGWNCAFCCGSNSIARRSAMEAIGNALPTGSITEDMLLTLALLRKGFVTRYLNEPMAIGLAPESLDAFFVQRGRWARGALQILRLREGPLGSGLTLVQRLMFLPAHWLSQSLTNATFLLAPCLFLLTGLLPLLNVTTEAILRYQLPAILGVITALRFFAPGQYFPLASTVLATLQSFRFLPMLIGTLIWPHGHAFKVTPKGRAISGGEVDRFTVITATAILAATGLGLALGTNIDWLAADHSRMIPIVALWCGFNAVVLLIALAAALSAPVLRSSERFVLDEFAALRRAGQTVPGRITDISLIGAAFEIDGEPPGWAGVGTWLALAVREVGDIPAQVVRCNGRTLGVKLNLPPSPERDRLIRKIFTTDLDNTTANDDAFLITVAMLSSIFRSPHQPAATQGPAAQSGQVADLQEPPSELLAEISARARDIERWDADLAAEQQAHATTSRDAA